MGLGDSEPVSLTEGDGEYEAAIADRAEAVRDVSEALFDTHREHVRTLTEQFHGDERVPGEELQDADDADDLRAYVERYCEEQVFPALNAVGSDESLTWNDFRGGVRALVEVLYLRAFEQYRAARDEFAHVARRRHEGKEALSDAQAALEYDDAEELAGEQSPAEAVANAASVVDAAETRVAAARTAVADAHYYYALASTYRTGQDVAADELDGVSLADDPDWYLQDLRHERDRLATRVEWLRTDFERLVDQP